MPLATADADIAHALVAWLVSVSAVAPHATFEHVVSNCAPLCMIVSRSAPSLVNVIDFFRPLPGGSNNNNKEATLKKKKSSNSSSSSANSSGNSANSNNSSATSQQNSDDNNDTVQMQQLHNTKRLTNALATYFGLTPKDTSCGQQQQQSDGGGKSHNCSTTRSSTTSASSKSEASAASEEPASLLSSTSSPDHQEQHHHLLQTHHMDMNMTSMPMSMSSNKKTSTTNASDNNIKNNPKLTPDAAAALLALVEQTSSSSQQVLDPLRATLTLAECTLCMATNGAERSTYIQAVLTLPSHMQDLLAVSMSRTMLANLQMDFVPVSVSPSQSSSIPQLEGTNMTTSATTGTGNNTTNSSNNKSVMMEKETVGNMMAKNKYGGHGRAFGRSYSMDRDRVPLHDSSSILNQQQQQQQYDGNDENRAVVALSHMGMDLDMGMGMNMSGGSRLMDDRMQQHHPHHHHLRHHGSLNTSPMDPHLNNMSSTVDMMTSSPSITSTTTTNSLTSTTSSTPMIPLSDYKNVMGERDALRRKTNTLHAEVLQLQDLESTLRKALEDSHDNARGVDARHAALSHELAEATRKLHAADDQLRASKLVAEELEVARAKAARADELQASLKRMSTRLGEMDNVRQLNSDLEDQMLAYRENETKLTATSAYLEDQVKRSSDRADKLSEVVDDMAKDLDAKDEQIAELAEENDQLKAKVNLLNNQLELALQQQQQQLLQQQQSISGSGVEGSSHSRSKSTSSALTAAAGGVDLSVNNSSNEEHDELDMTTDQVQPVGTLVAETNSNSKALVSSGSQTDTTTTTGTKDGDLQALVLMSPTRQATAFDAKAKQYVCDQLLDSIGITVGWDDIVECMKGVMDALNDMQQSAELEHQAAAATSSIPSTPTQQLQLQQQVRSSSQALSVRGGGAESGGSEALSKLSMVPEFEKLDAKLFGKFKGLGGNGDEFDYAANHCNVEEEELIIEDGRRGGRQAAEVAAAGGATATTTTTTAAVAVAPGAYDNVAASSAEHRQEQDVDRSTDMSASLYTDSELYDGTLTITTSGTRTAGTVSATASTSTAHGVAGGAEVNNNNMLVVQQQLHEQEDGQGRVADRQVDALRQQYHHHNHMPVDPSLLPDAANMQMNGARVVTTTSTKAKRKGSTTAMFEDMSTTVAGASVPVVESSGCPPRPNNNVGEAGKNGNKVEASAAAAASSSRSTRSSSHHSETTSMIARQTRKDMRELQRAMEAMRVERQSFASVNALVQKLEAARNEVDLLRRKVSESEREAEAVRGEMNAMLKELDASEHGRQVDEARGRELIAEKDRLIVHLENTIAVKEEECKTLRSRLDDSMRVVDRAGSDKAALEERLKSSQVIQQAQEVELVKLKTQIKANDHVERQLSSMVRQTQGLSNQVSQQHASQVNELLESVKKEKMLAEQLRDEAKRVAKCHESVLQDVRASAASAARNLTAMHQHHHHHPQQQPVQNEDNVQRTSQNGSGGGRRSAKFFSDFWRRLLNRDRAQNGQIDLGMHGQQSTPSLADVANAAADGLQQQQKQQQTGTSGGAGTGRYTPRTSFQRSTSRKTS